MNGIVGYANAHGEVASCVKLNWQDKTLYDAVLDTLTAAMPVCTQLCGIMSLADDNFAVYGTDQSRLDYARMVSFGNERGGGVQ